jgi:uncharacterized protein (DUF58 family)
MATAKEIISRVRRLELSTVRLVDGLLSGAYHSIFRGRGIEFSEVREYSYGDDIRSIDWNVTARMGHPYVKEFIEERDLSVLIMFDISRSGDFGSKKAKRESGVELAASLMFAALRNNDNVGLLLFSGKTERYIPLRKGRRHVLYMIRSLIQEQAKHHSSGLSDALKVARAVLKKRSIIFIISDFLFEETYATALKVMRNRHDVIMVRMGDARELELPDVGFIELEDAETGEQMLVDTGDRAFRNAYAKLMKQQHKAFCSNMRRFRIDTIDLLSGESHETELRNFFRMRQRRIWRS